jgi:hypothetical protein
VSLSRAEMLQAVKDGLIDATKSRAANCATNGIGEGVPAAAAQFENGMKELKDAYAAFCAVIDRIFPE